MIQTAAFQASSGLNRDPALIPGNTRYGAEPHPDQICLSVTLCVARDASIGLVALTSASRGSPSVAFSRQMAMYLSHVGFGMSHAAIGRFFGRDRTTVLHACHLVEDRRDDIWIDYRLAMLELACRIAIGEGR